jgi:hypothetical protein
MLALAVIVGERCHSSQAVRHTTTLFCFVLAIHGGYAVRVPWSVSGTHATLLFCLRQFGPDRPCHAADMVLTGDTWSGAAKATAMADAMAMMVL